MQTPSTQEKVVGLVQVSQNRDAADTNIDIIAIPGLDAASPSTWTWRAPGNPKDKKNYVNWLEDGNMLPSNIPKARIFTCDWPTSMLQQSVPTTLEQSAQFLLESVEQHLKQNKQARNSRPILFIASCLGGIVLLKALEIDQNRNDGNDSGYSTLVTATRGIIFLATPFRGTAFKDMPDLTLRIWAAFNDKTVTSLINYTRQPPPDLDELVKRFFHLQRKHEYNVFTFWEAHETSMLCKIYLGWLFSNRSYLTCHIALAALIPFLILHSASPWLLVFLILWRWGFHFYRPKQLVDENSARAHLFERERLNRRHVLMNKFGSPYCEDYKKVVDKVREITENIHECTPLEKADKLMREKYYTESRLRIERLSGEPLSLDQCYINLAIVESFGPDGAHSKGSTSSPFSLLSRQNIQAPESSKKIKLEEIFNQRDGGNAGAMHPRRILIRGRAGVGKTTLCKKIVLEFNKGTLGRWNELFDRVLWVPLRNLKLPARLNMPKYTFKDLFSHEFLLPEKEPDLAGALHRALEAASSRTIFLLDGLDEVSQDLAGEGSIPRFLKDLLSQPNVVITSRPSAPPPSNMDLELETIGFGPDQVNQYIEKSFINSKTTEFDTFKISKIQSFLQEHWLLQGLVRIPIQLDALCYTWDCLDLNTELNTMTGIYSEIELKLWKKDIMQLKKKHGNDVLTRELLASASTQKIEEFVQEELKFLECLAFTGLHNDVINFTSRQLHNISDQFTPSLLPSKTLSVLSFLRASHFSSEHNNRNYHFIHLTFQEYFAAKYFVRQWKDSKGQLEFLILNGITTSTETTATGSTDFTAFLRKYKYESRFDIFWRFVVGLLDKSGYAQDFMCAIEEEPLDLLGPAHQRLVMHCLSEIISNLPMREILEKRLCQWLLFECKFHRDASLAKEMEFPDGALKTALLCQSNDARMSILRCLASRPFIPDSITEVVAAQLSHEDQEIQERAVRVLDKCATLPDDVFTAMLARLNDKSPEVRRIIILVLGRRAKIPEKALLMVAARLNDTSSNVRVGAISALCQQKLLPSTILTAVAARLNDTSSNVRIRAISTLCQQKLLPSTILTAVAARLNDEDKYVRKYATAALGRFAVVPDEVLMTVVEKLDDRNMQYDAVWTLGRAAVPDCVLKELVARLNVKDVHIQSTAITALSNCATLPDEVFMALAGPLEHIQTTQMTAILALDRRVAVSDKLLAALMVRLTNEEKITRAATVMALGEFKELPNEVLLTLASHLEDKDSYVRETAANALQKQYKLLPDGVLAAVAALLNDEAESVRLAAVIALGGHKALPNEMLLAIAWLLDADEDVRRAALWALFEQKTLPNKILMAITLRLNDKIESIRLEAVRVLYKNEPLPNEVLIAIAARLDDADQDVQSLALKTLYMHKALPNEMLAVLTSRLDNEAESVRLAAINALARQKALPNEILTAIAWRLDDVDMFVRVAAIEALGQQKALSNHEVLMAIAWRLNDVYEYVVCAAIKALGEHKALPSEVLMAITSLLHDVDEDVRSAAIVALGEHKPLPSEVLLAIAARLDDQSYVVRSAAVNVLIRRQEYFSRDLFKVDHIAPLYKALLERSFEEQLSWHIENGRFYMNMPERTIEFCVGIRENEFMKLIHEARPDDYPSSIGRRAHPTTS